MAPPVRDGKYWKVVLLLSACIASAATQTTTYSSVTTVVTDSPETTAEATDVPITTATDPPVTTSKTTDPPLTTAVDPQVTTAAGTDPPVTTSKTTDHLLTTAVDPQVTTGSPGATAKTTDPPQATTIVTDPPITTEEVNDPAVTTSKQTDPPLTTDAPSKTNVPATPQPTQLPTEGIWLLCAADYILVEIPLELLVADDDYEDLTFHNQTKEECWGTNGTSQRDEYQDNTNFAIFNISLTDCGTHFEEIGDKHVYKNTITNKDTDGTISRQYEVYIPIECTYDRTVRVDSTWYKLEDYILDTDLQDKGEYKLDLEFFDSEQYDNAVRGFPMVVHLNDDLYFKASSQYSHLDLSIKSCRATLGETYEQEDSFDFITKWTVSDDEGEITSVTCQETPPIDALKVQTRAFRFLEGDADQEIYIHCDLFVCDKDKEDSKCKEACEDPAYSSPPVTPTMAGNDRRRRAADYAPPPLPVQRVTRGPIRIVRDTQSNQVESEYHGDIQSSTSPLWGFAMLAMGSVVIVLLAALVVTLRKLGNISSRGGGKTDEEETVGLMGK